jgi:hypothetical protein
MIGANMKKNKQFKKAKHLISDIVDSYILDQELNVEDDCEEREEILEALNLLLDLAKKAL